MEIGTELFKIAYKKLKSSLYYDKTQSIVRDKLVEFESSVTDIDDYLEKLAGEFFHEKTRTRLLKEILSSISFYAFPKKLKNDNGKMIKNYASSTIEIEDNQYFIDMDIRGHILGVLWLILIGYRVDEKMYKHSYGNRIRKILYNELSDAPTYSPYLFEPYFQQYESWRDTALNEAMQHLHAEQDIVILTLDFKRFYYSVDISMKLMDEIYENVIEDIEENSQELKSLNDFIYKIIEKYASLFTEFDNRNILPIGFLPSNVLANYALKNFDKAVLDGWNPIYYGRYVDDVIVVDKIENNSELFSCAQENELEAENVINYFLEQCSNWKGISVCCFESNYNYALLCKEEDKDEKNNVYKYVLNKLYNPVAGDKSKIEIKNEKVKVFYFKYGETDALLTCFRETIAKNKSEFRHMPEDEVIFQKDDYSKIYDLKNNETINKFRGIIGIEIDKFELSKLLGKYLRIGGLITDAKEMGFEAQFPKILNPRIIIENYNVWEKIIEILVINESWESLKLIVKKINESIEMLCYKNKKLLAAVKNTMHLYLRATLCRALTLVWGPDVDEFIKSLDFIYGEDQVQAKRIIKDVDKKRKAYCRTRMVDKSVMPIFIDMLRFNDVVKAKKTVNLCSFEHAMQFCKMEWKDNYLYYPFLLTMYDFSMISCIEQLKKQENKFTDLDKIYDEQVRHYVESNYGISSDASMLKQMIQIERFKEESGINKTIYLVAVDNDKKNGLKLAMANVRLDHHNFDCVVKDQPNRSYQRYKNMSKIINDAIDEKVDMLIMPEAYIPFEWLSTVARTCARNKLAIVSGIEHIKINENVYNLTAVILPYEDMNNRSAIISFHLKTHYAPKEKQEIMGYRLNAVEGKNYELYKWHDCYFPVYCCYELTSITERSLFQSYADFLVTIEWNKDVKYYSNILESLSRDIHCYCVQVNSSDYGDSRITKPSKTEEKDIMRTKGGINSTILVDEIDIEKLRDFQLKEYELQAYDSRFKPTPPGFKPEIVMKKIKGENILES